MFLKQKNHSFDFILIFRWSFIIISKTNCRICLFSLWQIATVSYLWSLSARQIAVLCLCSKSLGQFTVFISKLSLVIYVHYQQDKSQSMFILIKTNHSSLISMIIISNTNHKMRLTNHWNNTGTFDPFSAEKVDKRGGNGLLLLSRSPLPVPLENLLM